MPKNKSFEDRWREKVRLGGPDECWPWIASVDQDGYGRFQYPTPAGQRHMRAHRYGYELFVGAIPAGMVVMHSCDNPPCVNPAHLQLGTPLDNNADKVRKNRHAPIWGTPLNRKRQTLCIYGHPLSGDNLRIINGYRRCRECERVKARQWYATHGPSARPTIICIGCGESKPHRAHGRCSTCDQAWRRSRGGDDSWGLVS